MSNPNWTPAERVVSDLLPDLMWMTTIEHAGLQIEQYKHRDTRKYLNLDGSGAPYRVRYGTSGSTPTEVTRIDLETARAHVLS